MQTDHRLDRLTLPDYLDGLERADTARIRRLRDECRAKERRLSYVRRMVQGHLDLATGERERRGEEQGDALVARVAHALTGAGGGARSRRAVGLRAPDDGGDLDSIVSARLLDHLDQLQATLVERYRDDSAALEDVALRGTDHR